MKLFKCSHCGQLLYFENNRCEQCGYKLGFNAETLQLMPLLDMGNDTYWTYDEQDTTLYRYCTNYQFNVCNWLVPETHDSPFCQACSLNRTIPNISKTEYMTRWQTIEVAKHRLVYSLLRLKLPVLSKTTDPEKGLTFDFMADEQGQKNKRVLTGHANGLITINIAEADDIEREMARRAMEELYRTVLGHFRHEVGHYYWERLIYNTENLGPFRQLFGDERTDYGQALQKHYAQGAPVDWDLKFISSYATAHPWEDWAETWAHYLHIIDTLETAYAFGLKVRPEVVEAPFLAADINSDPFELENFQDMMNLWLPLTFAMNSLNRSMGLSDPYPFVIRPKVIKKLSFIHQVVFAAKGKTLSELG